MAAVAELFLLLFPFIRCISTQEPLTILEEKGSYTFNLPEEGNFCSISRFVGEQKLVLWNTSEHCPNDRKVPEDMKEHCLLFDRANISSHMIHNLSHSNSGLYQVECWTEENIRHEENISIVVCSRTHKMRSVQGSFESTVVLKCEGAADNRTVKWLRGGHRNEQGEKWTSISLTSDEEDRLQVKKKTSELSVSNFNLDVFGPYTCLVMDKQQCISSHPVAVIIQTEVVYRSVGERAVLHCIGSSFSNDPPVSWNSPTKIQPVKSSQNSSDNLTNFTEQQQNVSSKNPELNQNFSLVFSSLTLNNTGAYICMRSRSWNSYFLVVCPKSGPPAVEYFSEGDEVTLRCNHSLGEDVQPIWFMKRDHVEDTIVKVSQFYKEKSSINRNVRNKINMSSSYDNMVLSNVSVEERGEYWCAVVDKNDKCVLAAKTLLVYREPFWFYFVWNTARSLVLVILCVVVLTVILKTRRSEHHSHV